MKILRLQFFITKMLLFLIMVLGCINLNAQTRFRIEPGVLLKTESENLGLMINFEPNIKVSANTVIGLRFGISINSQEFKTNDNSQFFIDEENDNAVISFVPTFDYYLNENYYRPYLGLGIGYYLLSPIDVTKSDTQNIVEGMMKNQLGLLVRGGLEFGRTRVGLEYNFVPEANIKVTGDQKVGSVVNSYFGISVGVLIGGGRNSR